MPEIKKKEEEVIVETLPVEETTETVEQVSEESPVVEETTETVEAPATETVPKVSINVQERIDRMYARLQSERARRTTAETNLETIRETARVTSEDSTNENEGLSRDDIEAIRDRKEKEKQFKNSETTVLMRHTHALNNDGSFNMNSEFTRRYIDTGRRNSLLAMMENGPELAEAQVEKEMVAEISRKKVATTQHATAVNNATTGRSTVAVSAATIVKLSDIEQKIARRMGMTSVQYADYKKKIQSGDKRAGY